MNTTPKIYLAGPQVFLKEAFAHSARLKSICEKHGLEGVFPVDGEEFIMTLPKKEAAQAICTGNLKLIEDCDGVIACITPYRGIAADNGTAFEIGYAVAKEKIVCLYTTDERSLEERTRTDFYEGRTYRDEDGAERGIDDDLMLETFELADNLMLPGSVYEQGGAVFAVSESDQYQGIQAFEQAVIHMKNKLLVKRAELTL